MRDGVAYAGLWCGVPSMKVSDLDLEYLRRGLCSHPRLAQHVAGLDLERMRAKELVALAKQHSVLPPSV
jgi:hypothetical protein